jgi:hypothetical protein
MIIRLQSRIPTDHNTIKRERTKCTLSDRTHQSRPIAQHFMADHNLIGHLTGEDLIDVSKGSIALLGNGKISRTQLRWI